MNLIERFTKQRMTKIIDFEGLDCCFKETNSKFLTECLLKWGLKGKRYAFPNYDSPSSYFVKQWLSKAYDGMNLSFVAVENLYLLDQMDTFQQIAKEAEEEDFDFIVLDRFWPSGVYYNTATDTAGIKSRFESINTMRKMFKSGVAYVFKSEQVRSSVHPVGACLADDSLLTFNESNHSFLRDVHHNFKIWLDNLEGYIEFKNHKVILKRIQVYHQAEDSTDVLKTREELCDEFQQLANELARYIGVKVC